MKKVLVIILTFLLVFVGCKSTSYINTKDNINDKDEALMKEFRSHHGYSNNELRNLKIKYLGTVDGFTIYYVPLKNNLGEGEDWAKDGYTFPVKCHAKIIGIKSSRLYTIGKLLFENNINVKQLYEILPQEFKTK